MSRNSAAAKIEVGDTVNLDGADHEWTLTDLETDEHGRSIMVLRLVNPPQGVQSVTRRVDPIRVTPA